MTDSDKESEIVARITRLNDIRAELAIARAAFKKSCLRLSNTGRYYGTFIRNTGESRSVKPESWPSYDEVIDIEETTDT